MVVDGCVVWKKGEGASKWVEGVVCGGGWMCSAVEED